MIATSASNRIDLYTTAILNLDVIDVNNNAPRVYVKSREYEDDDIIRESYRENRRGQEVIEIEADDADSGPNGDIGWSLDSNDPDSIYFRQGETFFSLPIENICVFFGFKPRNSSFAQ